MAVAMAGFTMNDTITKAVSSEMNFGQVMLVRGLFAIALIAALAWHQRAVRPLRTLMIKPVALRVAGEVGGTVSFLAACRLSGLKAAVCYYGGGIARFADEKPKCPTQMHFGCKDAHITMDLVDEIKKKRPECEIYVYDEADHGFHCDERGSHHAESAKIAWGRTTAFLEKNMK